MPEELRMQIEREAMRVIEDRRKDKGLTIDVLAAILYPDKSIPAARMMIQRLRAPQGEKPPRKMDLGEYVELTKAVGLDPGHTLSAILQSFKETKI